jgi:spore maturation protein CgeB
VEPRPAEGRAGAVGAIREDRALRFLIADTYYPTFWRGVYGRNEALERRPYQEQLDALLGLTFGTADFYSWNLRQLGHEAVDVIGNCEPLQRQWAREKAPALLRSRRWLLETLSAQIRAHAPDVLYVQDMNWPDAAFYREIRPHVRLIVGQTAYPMRPDFDYGSFDLVLTSFPHYLPFLRRHGLACEYVPLAFDRRVLERLGETPRQHGAVFVGSFSPRHSGGTSLLEEVARRVPLEVWGYPYESLPVGSPLRDRYRGEAFGLEMYRVLAASRIVLNRHIDVAGRFANNLRLYEATGVGACLLTDARDNLGDLFEPGREVLVYRTAEECAELVAHYLANEPERQRIAEAGQRRTLGEHTYRARMQEVARHVERHLASPAARGERAVFLVGPPAVPSRARGAISLVGQALARLPPPLSTAAAAVSRRLRAAPPPESVSTGHSPVREPGDGRELARGWQDPAIPERQRRLVEHQLDLMYTGRPPTPFQVLAQAMAAAGEGDPLVFEVGCASGYHAEVLGHLLHRRLRYVGIDYSAPLVEQARACYPDEPFVVGDAARLPMRDRSCDVLLSGAVLLHVPDYAAAVRETARVARRWCVFHRTPVITDGPTALFKKQAYGVEVGEWVFNERELTDLFAAAGFPVQSALAVESYRLEHLAEPVRMVTFVCRAA